MTEPTPLDLGQAAYAAYGESTGHRTHQGQPMPAWDELGETIQQAWIAAADAVAQAVTAPPDAEQAPAGDSTAQPAVPEVVPSVGRIVLVPADPSLNNGADVAPALVCRVWNATTINVRVLGDSPDTEWRTSLTYTPELGAPDLAVLNPLHRWTWPPRV